MSELDINKFTKEQWDELLEKVAPGSGVIVGVTHPSEYTTYVYFYSGEDHIFTIEADVKKQTKFRVAYALTLGNHNPPRHKTFKVLTQQKLDVALKTFVEGCLAALKSYKEHRQHRDQLRVAQQNNLERIKQMLPNAEGPWYGLRANYTFGTMKFEAGGMQYVEAKFALPMEKAEAFFRLLKEAEVIPNGQTSTQTDV